MNNSKMLNFGQFHSNLKKIEDITYYSEIPIDEIGMMLIKKHDEVMNSIPKFSGIKAVAFNFLYHSDGRLIDINDVYLNRSRSLEDVFIANRYSTAFFSRTERVNTWIGKKGGQPSKKEIKYLVPKYLVISKRGINKQKLKPEEFYFYNHLNILMSNKITFDRLLDSSIVEKSNTMIKFLGNELVPEVVIR